MKHIQLHSTNFSGALVIHDTYIVRRPLQCRVLNVSFDNKNYSFLFLEVKMKDFDVSLE